MSGEKEETSQPSLLSFFYAAGLLLVCINQTREPIMTRIVIFRAHLPEHIGYAKQLIGKGRKALIHTDQVTPEVGELSKNPLVQSRFGSTNSLTFDAGLVIQ